VDELPLTFAALALSLAWFAWRRWKHAELELQLRVSAQAALVQREAQYRMLFMESFAAHALADVDGQLSLCNPAMAQMLELDDPRRVHGRSLCEFYADASLWTRHRDQLARGESLEIPQLELIGAQGAAVKAIARMVPHRLPGGELELQIYLADISELKLMQRELGDTLAENRLLSQRYLLVQEEERRNLARELHDEMGQCINAIKLDAVSIRDLARGRDPDIEGSANAIIELSGHVYDSVRGIIQRLRPAALDALGLHDAVGDLVAQWQRRNGGVACTFTAAGDLSDLGEVVNITIYRFVQECLTNVAKHAQAAQVTVSLERRAPGEIAVAVLDDGRGMDIGAKRTGLGLVGLRERVEALNGAVHIESTPGCGLSVAASIPMAAQG